MSIQSNDPFFGKCIAGNKQLVLNTFANGPDGPYTFNCCIECSANEQPPFQCSEAFTELTLCIGGVNQQHACGCAFDGGLVQWSAGNIAPRCPDHLLSFISVQTPGVATTCCDLEFSSCIAAAKEHPADQQGYSCDIGRPLTLCVTDGLSSECVTPGQNNNICSGNFSSVLGFTPSPLTPTSSDPFAFPTPGATLPPEEPPGGSNTNSDSSSNTPTGSASSSSSPFSGADIATIVGSVIGGVASIIAISGAVYKITTKKKKAKNQDPTHAANENHHPSEVENGNAERSPIVRTVEAGILTNTRPSE